MSQVANQTPANITADATATVTATATATATSTATILSKCGYAMRRQLLVRSANSWRDESFATQPLEHDSRADPLHVAVATTLTTAFARSRLCPPQSKSHRSCGSFWALSVTLLILTASYLPATALPRRAIGRHLILPHRHHVHLRSADQAHPHPHPHPHRQPHAHMASSESPDACKLNLTAASLQEAVWVARETRKDIYDIQVDWLNRTMPDLQNDTSEILLESARRKYSLHSLDVDYPLKTEVNNTSFDGTTNNSPCHDLQRINSSLNILRQVMGKVEQKKQHTDDFSRYFEVMEKLDHNRYIVGEILNETDHTPEPSFNESHLSLTYAVVNEVLMLLQVIEKMYNVMLQTVSE